MKKFSLLRVGLVDGHLKNLRGCPISAFVFLLSIANRWGIATASYKEIGMKTGYSFPITLKALQKLKKPDLEGLPYIIPLLKKNSGMTQLYWLPRYNLDFLDYLIASSIKTGEGDLIKKIDKVFLNSLIEGYQNSLQGVIKKVNKVEAQRVEVVKEIEVKKPKKKREVKALGFSPGFEAFWVSYPRQIEKRGAFKNWLTRLKEGETEENLIKAGKNYAEKVRQKGTEEDYIKKPSNFLGRDLPFQDYIEIKTSLDLSPSYHQPIQKSKEMTKEEKEKSEKGRKEFLEGRKKKDEKGKTILLEGM